MPFCQVSWGVWLRRVVVGFGGLELGVVLGLGAWGEGGMKRGSEGAGFWRIGAKVWEYGYDY